MERVHKKRNVYYCTCSTNLWVCRLRRFWLDLSRGASNVCITGSSWSSVGTTISIRMKEVRLFERSVSWGSVGAMSVRMKEVRTDFWGLRPSSSFFLSMALDLDASFFLVRVCDAVTFAIFPGIGLAFAVRASMFLMYCAKAFEDCGLPAGFCGTRVQSNLLLVLLCPSWNVRIQNDEDVSKRDLCVVWRGEGGVIFVNKKYYGLTFILHGTYIAFIYGTFCTYDFIIAGGGG